MEYARLTDGKITIIVIDQDNEENSAWPFAIKIKTGPKRFEHYNSRTNLQSAIQEAVQRFNQLALS